MENLRQDVIDFVRRSGTVYKSAIQLPYADEDIQRMVANLKMSGELQGDSDRVWMGKVIER